MALVVPSRSANATFALRHVSVSEESDHREEPQQRRGGPLDRPFRPMPLGFEPEALAGLLECGLHLPAFHEPRDHPLRIGIEVGAQNRAWVSNSSCGSRISTQRTGTAGKPVEYQSAVSETISTVRCAPPYQSLT